MDKNSTAKWIMDQRFNGLMPIDVFHKENAEATDYKHNSELQNIHMLVRKSVDLQKAPGEAFVEISADDYYKLYINGHFVGQGPAQGIHDHYFYNKHDVTPYLQAGENVIGVHVYYHGLISRSYSSGDYRQGMIAELHADGILLAQSDRTWKYSLAKEYVSGGTIGYDTQFLENINSRLRQKGWREPGYDDSAWLPCSEHPADDHHLVAQPTPPLAVYRQQPVLVEPIEGGILIDFGQELTGQLTVRAKGKPGQTVEIRCGEERLPTGRVRYDMRCNCIYKETWTLSGEWDEPEFYDYKAFRYAEVLMAEGIELEADSIAAIVRHYPLDEEACSFDSSNPLLNSIWSICKNGVKFGTQENYVDCPSREKGQYLGDNTVITHAHAYLSGDLTMFRKAVEDFALFSAKVCPGLMAVAPGHFMQEIADFSLQWPGQLLQYYRLSGDKEFLERMYPVAAGLMEFFRGFKREDGLLDSMNDKWNLVDWPENLRDGYDFALIRGDTRGMHNVINAFYYGALQTMSEIQQLLLLPAEADTLRELESFRAAFRRVFYKQETRLFVDAEGSTHSSLHANALALLFGLAPEEAIGSIVTLIREKRLSCGVYMAYFVLKALAAAREYELLFELIVSDDLHSWSTMVKEGATTCFEAWSKELKWNTSLCHPWASAPVPLLIEEIIGLKPAAPGWSQVRFTPRIPGSLERIEVHFRVPAGEVRFEYDQGKMSLTVPEGIEVVESDR